jgi:hypothetical protein
MTVHYREREFVSFSGSKELDILPVVWQRDLYAVFFIQMTTLFVLTAYPYFF